ncbi:LA_2272 family surface repeat-containing protein [Pyxidicoccus sp. 3LG]
MAVPAKGGAELRAEHFVPVTLTRTAARGGEGVAPGAGVTDVHASEVDVPTVPFNLSLVPPLSTSTLWGGSGLNHVALGGLAVRSLQLRGLGAAGGVGWVDGTMEGLQVSGIANVAGGEMLGLQVAIGGNLAYGGGTGAQVSAVFNMAEGGLSGLQLSSMGNRAAADMRGFQAAAGINLSERLAGAQLGLINISGDVAGAQVGLINVATHVRGLQLGLINIADDVSVPIGILSIVRKGRFAFEVSSDDVSPLSVSIKYGSRTVYVLATEGLRIRDGSVRTMTLVGLGVHFPLGEAERYYLDVDVATRLLGDEGEGSLNRLRAMVGLELKRRFAVFAGVSLNLYAPYAEEKEPDVSLLPQWKLGRGPGATRVWPGLLLGVRI